MNQTSSERHVRIAGVEVRRSKAAATLSLMTSLALTSCVAVFPDVTPSPTSSLELPDRKRAACGPNGIPRTTEEYLCADRRIGKLAVVVAPGLTDDNSRVAIDLSPGSNDAAQAADYAVNILRLATDGAIDLTPEVIQASPGMIQAIRDSGGDSCTDTNDPNDAMSMIIKDALADDSSYVQIMTLGGQACGQEDGDVVAGWAGYEPEQKMLDIYNQVRSAGMSYMNSNKITDVGSHMAHELWHNYRLSHSGEVYFDDPQLADAILDGRGGVVDFGAYLTLPATNVEYGDLGNVMGNNARPVEPGAKELPRSLMNPVQLDRVNAAIDPRHYTRRMQSLFIPDVPVTIDSHDPEPAAGIRVTLPNPVVIDKTAFTDVYFTPLFRDKNVAVMFSLGTAEQNGPLLMTTNIGQRILQTSDTVAFRIDEWAVSLTTSNGVMYATLTASQG